jgi:hypothetical protein
MGKLWSTLPLALLIAAPAVAVDMHCVDRDGRCMAVMVNGQKAVKLSKSTKKIVAGMKRGQNYAMDARYEVPEPIRGALDVKADRSSDSKDWFGEGRVFEIMVVPLADVDLKTQQRLSTAEGVQISGAAPLTVENVLEGNRLPAGPYLLLVTLRGESNWDRMTLFVQVAE